MDRRQASPASTGSRGTTTHCTWIPAMPKVLATSIPLCTANVTYQLHEDRHERSCKMRNVRGHKGQAVVEFKIFRMAAEYCTYPAWSMMILMIIDAYDLIMTYEFDRECGNMSDIVWWCLMLEIPFVNQGTLGHAARMLLNTLAGQSASRVTRKTSWCILLHDFCMIYDILWLFW